MPQSRRNYEVPAGERPVTTCLRLPESIRDAYREAAKRTGCSMSMLMVGTLETALESGAVEELAASE